jgi:putative oxidoreductase
MDLALLIARLILGLGLAAHGTQKLFGWLGGYGVKGTGGFFESLGFRPGPLFAVAAGLGELGGGLLTVVGLLGPVGPSLMVLVMAVAILSVHWRQGFFADNKGMELPLMYATGAFVLAFTGPGAYSLDRFLGLSALSGTRTAWVAIALALLLALINVGLRRPAAGARSAPRA